MAAFLPLLLCSLWIAGSTAELRAAAERARFLASAPPLVNETDCLIRSYAIERALEVNPLLSNASVYAMIDALSGDPTKGAGCVVRAPATMPAPQHPTSLPTSSGSGLTFFVSAVNGSDSGDGSIGSPFLTISAALAATRAAGGGGTINLRGGGTFHLASTLTLTAADSGLTLQTYPADPQLAWLSGALPLAGEALQWRPVNTSSGANIWAVDLSALRLAGLSSLRLAGARLPRARYPNGDPETSLPFARHGGSITAQAWVPLPSQQPASYWTAPSNYSRNDSACSAYTIGLGGTSCGLFSPSASHYCGSPLVPGGVLLAASALPRLPTYRDPAGAVITAMHGGSWCTFQYAVSSLAYNASSGLGLFSFSGGGQQCGRPEASHGALVIEGVLEELDAPGEWHYSAASGVLTLWHNASSGTPPPTDGSLAAPQLQQLLAAAGSQAAPLTGLSLLRLGWRDTPPSAFEPHTAPSGSDYAVNRAAAVSLVGVAGARVEGCSFTRLDNSALFLGGWARGVRVAGNEFSWLGENGIVSLGDSSGAPVQGLGPDGSEGNQPWGTVVQGNVARELGVVNKQSCFYFQAVSSNASIVGNVVFNGARHGVQYNDDFGTGSVLRDNVMFSEWGEGGGGEGGRDACLFSHSTTRPLPPLSHSPPADLNRETADTGLWNNWDRLPFTPRKDAQHVDLHTGNLMIANFNSFSSFDTDDCSAYHLMRSNVQLYGHSLKSDFSGHDVVFRNHLSIFGAGGNQYQPLIKGYFNTMSNCTLLAANDGNVLMDNVCPNATDFPRITNTTVLTPTGSVQLCGQSVSYWQKAVPGVLQGVVAAPIPDTLTAEDIVSMARDTLAAE